MYAKFTKLEKQTGASTSACSSLMEKLCRKYYLRCPWKTKFERFGKLPGQFISHTARGLYIAISNQETSWWKKQKSRNGNHTSWILVWLESILRPASRNKAPLLGLRTIWLLNKLAAKKLMRAQMFIRLA